MTETEIREAISQVLRSVRHERAQWDAGLEQLRAMLRGPEGHVAVDLLAMASKQEKLEFQWRLNELVEEIKPPPPPKPEVAKEPEPEPEPEPELAPEVPAGALSPDDLRLIAQDPRGFALAEHRTTGDWYVVTDQDPVTGALQARKLSEAERRALKAQLGVL